MRRHISSGSPFEAAYGYSRAVIDGDLVFVSGTTGFDYATMAIEPDAAGQTRRAFDNVARALAEAGATLADVVAVRYIVAERADWEAIGRVAGEILREVRPAATAMMAGLIDPRMKIEIEAIARRR